MKDLRVEKISKSIGMKQLFTNISFAISAGEHVGLIGQNGTGKSTLLKILAGIEHADSGIIEHAKDFRIAYLPQEPEYDDEQTIFEVVYLSDHPLLNAVRQYELATQKLAQTPDDERIQQLFTHAEQEMTRQQAWDMDVTVRTILKKIGILDVTKKMKELSGGMKKRVGLAQVLLTEPDLLLLDEPTNHLDVESIKWLEDYLSKYKGSLVVITHDRYFLENVVDRIFHLADRTIQTYVGNYETYVEQRAQREATQQKMAHQQQRLYSKELEWMRQGAKARTTKQQARIQRFNELKEEIHQQKSEAQLAITLDQQRIGKRVFHIEEVSLRVADRLLFDRFSLIVQAQDRIGIVGDNGVGKSSLLHALAGLLPFSKGTFTVGQTVRIAYYRQTNDAIPVEKPLITYLREYAEEVKQKNGEVASVTALLEMFLFPKEMHSVTIQTLSGGERRRLYLLKLLMMKPNVLLLDEPTNDLDIDTLTVLEQYIEDFNGAVFIVSHDRYFLDKTVDQLIEIDGQGNTHRYLGTMSEYLAYKKEKMDTDTIQSTQLENVKKASETDTPKIAKLTYHEKKEWDTLEDRITQLEEDILILQTNMMQNSHDMVKLQTLQQQLDEVQVQLERAMLRWEELAPRAE